MKKTMMFLAAAVLLAGCSADRGWEMCSGMCDSALPKVQQKCIDGGRAETDCRQISCTEESFSPQDGATACRVVFTDPTAQ